MKPLQMRSAQRRSIRCNLSRREPTSLLARISRPTIPGRPSPSRATRRSSTTSRPACKWRCRVKAAMANKAAITRMKNGAAEVSFTIDGKYRMNGTIDTQNHVKRVRTWISQSIVGDMLVETEYTGYQDFSGVQFPSRIVQRQDG